MEEIFLNNFFIDLKMGAQVFYLNDVERRPLVLQLDLSHFIQGFIVALFEQVGHFIYGYPGAGFKDLQIEEVTECLRKKCSVGGEVLCGAGDLDYVYASSSVLESGHLIRLKVSFQAIAHLEKMNRLKNKNEKFNH